MTDMTAPASSPSRSHSSLLTLDERTRKRNAGERRFRMYGVAAVATGVIALILLLISILSSGLPSFTQTFINAEIYLDPEALDPEGNRDPDDIRKVLTFSYQPLIQSSLAELATEMQAGPAPELTEEMLAGMVSEEATAQLRNFVISHPDEIGNTVEFEFLANARIDQYLKGKVTMASAELDSRVDPAQLRAADAMVESGRMEKRFNWDFFTNADASENRPEAAGLGVAIIGSAYMMLIVLCLALPIGVAASIYLEEFAKKNWLTDVIEVNISNLAAVPSIVFGILGLAIFINYMGLPNSAPIVGGLVLTLMTLPTIIISTRAALKSVPPSIRDAALGVGASKMQTVFHHVLPLAMPGILTGTIIGLAQALGETAPLLLIGMVAFVKEYPSAPPEGFFEPATGLPVQVYNFTQRADPAFVERASGAIIVLLIFLLAMNLIAVILRRRFERRW
ncbi:phosphate ABC transporter permease PstA [Qingshengfaniella alkalisoli]|uniref:Phosphate transport system permease protein PstA n=1 Tax=Qingshengfaniella alkalisoli TaxID=2599296 RepID=A0A5B8IBB7_9RHOB|nr:phosphate ABC transporter permease PstA [Qingshengfaniella alkalisoli]QDY71479.1 phosphate ABC transporter permease PstA [Qingshengfaniella alkalisoli]